MEVLTADNTTKMYRNSTLTVEEFYQLPIPEREALNRHLAYVEKNPDKVAAALSQAQLQDGETVSLEYEDGPASDQMPDFDALASAATEATAPGQEAPVMAPVEVESEKVYMTTDYAMFRLMPENRPVMPAHVKAIVGKISEKNLLKDSPMLVTPGLEVVDGQHRLAAAQELGVPIYYRVSELASEDIATLNTANKNWTGTDYLHYWTVLGKDDYQRLTKFMQTHPGVSFSNAKNMLSRSSIGGLDEFKRGLWRAGEVEQAEVVAMLMRRIYNETSFKRSHDTRFVMALHYSVVNVAGFDPTRFMDKILLNPTVLEVCASHKQYLAMFEKLYNYRSAVENRIRFV